jgi:hypothetical protein
VADEKRRTVRHSVEFRETGAEIASPEVKRLACVATDGRESMYAAVFAADLKVYRKAAGRKAWGAELEAGAVI